MMKSPTPRCWRRDCSVTKEEEIWIIKHSGGRGATALRHLFICRHNLSNHHAVPHKNAFKRLVQRFNAKKGVIGTNRRKTLFAVTPENIARMEAFFEGNPTKSIAMAVRELDISFGSNQFFYSDKEAICKFQGAKKVMCWAALGGDSVLPLRWMD